MNEDNEQVEAIEEVVEAEIHWPLEAFIQISTTPAIIAAELARRGIITPEDVRRRPATVGKAFALAYKPDMKRVFISVNREAKNG